ncbi:hypothetical protein GCM10007112_02200 [Vulcanisaeta souniana JCM 11219]|uniref:Uncharacterized protein n=2 Tax=Vulcanisaeta souniana JCM 11219 TaxID=1293586 RepID=A0A830ECE9_9CREN|nr:hypothetical protein GCM10007112_02200 [Vulcanisaeta souniana JCM 11219]
MIVLRSSKLMDIVAEFGNKLNEVLRTIEENHAYNPDNDLMNRIIRELRSKGAATLVKGNASIVSKVNGIEVTFVLTADGYKNIMRDIVNYYTNILMSIKQVLELTNKLGVSDEYTVIISDSAIDILIGYSLPDLSETPLLSIPSVKETIEIPSVLSNVTKMTADEVAKIMVQIDNVISSLGNISSRIETVIKLDDIEYPEPFKVIEKKVGGVS